VFGVIEQDIRSLEGEFSKTQVVLVKQITHMAIFHFCGVRFKRLPGSQFGTANHVIPHPLMSNPMKAIHAHTCPSAPLPTRQAGAYRCFISRSLRTSLGSVWPSTLFEIKAMFCRHTGCLSKNINAEIEK